MLYVPLEFKNGLKIDALVVVDSSAQASAIGQNDIHRVKQQDPNKVLKIDDPLSFQIQVTFGQLAKPLATATLNFDIGDNTLAEHFVIMNEMTGPIIGLQFMLHHSVVIDTTQGLILFPQLTMQVKSAASDTGAKP